MDLLDTVTGRTEASRRALLRGAVVAVTGFTGYTAARTDGEQAVSYLTDDNTDDETPMAESANYGDELGDGDGTNGGDDGDSNRLKEVVSQVDLTEREGRVTIRLGAYERVVADLNGADGNSIGHSAWRVDGKRAARSGVSFRALEGDTIQVTLQNPTPIPYSISVRTDESDEGRVTADGRGVTVYAGGVETLTLDGLAHGKYDYEIETLTRPIEPLTGRLLVDAQPATDAEATNT